MEPSHIFQNGSRRIWRKFRGKSAVRGRRSSALVLHRSGCQSKCHGVQDAQAKARASLQVGLRVLRNAQAPNSGSTAQGTEGTAAALAVQPSLLHAFPDLALPPCLDSVGVKFVFDFMTIHDHESLRLVWVVIFIR
ncbi:unnamed protein product [Symbiodinium sp. CCMP2592]|nr:unnamed protein product [Symbiodinium sp. CCMP2592]